MGPAMKLSCLGNDKGYRRSVRTSVLSLHKFFLAFSGRGTLSVRQGEELGDDLPAVTALIS